MGTFILTWNTTNKGTWASFEEDLTANKDGYVIEGDWSVGPVGRRRINDGDWFFLLRQGEEPRGLIAAGTVTGPAQEDKHWNQESGATTYYAPLEFETILDPTEILQTPELLARVPGFHWQRVQQSGYQVHGDAEADLHDLWAEHLAGLGIDQEWVTSEEAEARLYTEGERITVTVSRIERDPAARDRCIERYGTSCSVCGMDFEKVYGPIGAGYIHVHHLNPLSVSGPAEIDPIRDLRPVCPNCHAMLHAGGLKSIKDLKLATKKAVYG